jgi:glycine/D-amino acid oxidase-like deaminating enzyme
VHDYGHGGAGITLAWGCAEEVRDLLRPRLAPPADVAVLGAGIIGMTAAWALGEAGYRVTLYAERFTPATTSDVAGGQFAPSIVDLDSSLERRHRFDRILRRSFARYAAQVGDRYGVARRDNYATAGHGDGLARIPRGIFPPPEDVDLPFPGPPRRGQLFRTLLIEPPIYLPRLLADLEANGVRRVRRRFESADELAGIPERALVDCLGLGAGALFGDRALIPVRGQLVRLRPQALPYLLSHEGYLFPRRDALVLGGTVEWNVRSPEVEGAAVARILARHRAFFGEGALA